MGALVRNIGAARTELEAIRCALLNIDQFDKDGFIRWLQARGPTTIRLAHRWPPNQIYKLPTGTLVVIEGYYERHVGVRLVQPGAPSLDVTASMLEDATNEARQKVAASANAQKISGTG